MNCLISRDLGLNPLDGELVGRRHPKSNKLRVDLTAYIPLKSWFLKPKATPASQGDSSKPKTKLLIGFDTNALNTDP